MNGLLTFNDGAGTVIENGTITTQSLSLNNILATLPTATVNLWSNFTTGVLNIGNSLTSGYVNIGNKCNVYINSNGTTEETIISPNVIANAICSLGSSANTNYVGNIEIIGSQINSKDKTKIIDIGNELTLGYVRIATDIIQVMVSSFTFLGKSLQAGTSGTINLFTTLTSGTLNFGNGGNINIGSALTGSLIQIDQNGLDNQVIISPQQSATGVVNVGSGGTTSIKGFITNVGVNATTNSIVNIGGTGTGSTINLGSSNKNVNVGSSATTVNVGSSATTLNVGNSATNINVNTTGTGTTNVGSISCNTNVNGDIVSIGNNSNQIYIGNQTRTTVINGNNAIVCNNTTTTVPSYVEVGSYAPNCFLDFHSGGYGVDVDFDARIFCDATNTTTAGTGLLTLQGGNLRLQGSSIRLIDGGLRFDKGTLNSGSWVPQCGVQPLQVLNVPAGGNVQQTVAFGYTFSANPYITATIIIGAVSSVTDSLLITIYDVTTSNFKVNIKNTTGTATGSNTWGYHYIAWAPY
jgi:hypothetical protein